MSRWTEGELFPKVSGETWCALARLLVCLGGSVNEGSNGERERAGALTQGFRGGSREGMGEDSKAKIQRAVHGEGIEGGRENS